VGWGSWWAASGTVLWARPDFAERYTGPAVGNGLVYFGSDFHTVTALSVKDGRGVWQYTVGDIIDSPPAVTSTAVYIASYDGYLYALSAAKGKLIWHSTAARCAPGSPWRAASFTSGPMTATSTRSAR
jgi:outer membrane protein assembly factor BamB